MYIYMYIYIYIYIYTYCRSSCVLLYFVKLKVVCLTLDTWWSLLTPVVFQIIKYV